MTIYTLKVELSQTPYDEGDGTWRVIEIKGSQTLDQLHRIIFKAFGRWEHHLYSFYMSGDRRDASREYASPYLFEDEDFPLNSRPHNAKQTRLDELSLRLGQKFNYVFDYGDYWEHVIAVLSVSDESEVGRYPRVVERHGESPPQYPRVPENEYGLEDQEEAQPDPAKITHLFRPKE